MLEFASWQAHWRLFLWRFFQPATMRSAVLRRVLICVKYIKTVSCMRTSSLLTFARTAKGTAAPKVCAHSYRKLVSRFASTGGRALHRALPFAAWGTAIQISVQLRMPRAYAAPTGCMPEIPISRGGPNLPPVRSRFQAGIRLLDAPCAPMRSLICLPMYLMYP